MLEGGMVDDPGWIVRSSCSRLSVSNEEVVVKSENQKQRHEGTCVFMWLHVAISWRNLGISKQLNIQSRISKQLCLGDGLYFLRPQMS